MKYDVAIVGTGGPIAQSLVETVTKNGLNVIGFGRTPLSGQFIKFDVGQNSNVQEVHSAKTLIFNAAIKGRFQESSKELANQMAVNAPDFEKLLKNLNLKCDRILTMGSSEEYGPRETSTEIGENDETNPISSYGKSKLALYRNAMKWSQATGRTALHLRIFNVFGPGADPKMFIGQLISTLQKNSVFEMTKGEQWRSFISLSLLTKCIYKILNLNSWETISRGQCLNISTDNYFQIRQVADLVRDHISSGEVHLGALPYRADEIWQQKPNLDLLKAVMGSELNENFGGVLKETLRSQSHT